jgi:hypothetical protein
MSNVSSPVAAPAVPITKAQLRAYYAINNWTGPATNGDIAQLFNTSRAMATAVRREMAVQLAGNGQTLTEPSWHSNNMSDITDDMVTAAIEGTPGLTASIHWMTRIIGNVLACSGGDPAKVALIQSACNDMVLSAQSLETTFSQL